MLVGIACGLIAGLIAAAAMAAADQADPEGAAPPAGRTFRRGEVSIVTILLVRPTASGGLAAHVDQELALLEAAGRDVREAPVRIRERPDLLEDLRTVRTLRQILSSATLAIPATTTTTAQPAQRAQPPSRRIRRVRRVHRVRRVPAVRAVSGDCPCPRAASRGPGRGGDVGLEPSSPGGHAA